MPSATHVNVGQAFEKQTKSKEKFKKAICILLENRFENKFEIWMVVDKLPEPLSMWAILWAIHNSVE